MTLFQLRVSAVTVELYTPNNAAWFQRLLILVTDLPGLTQMFFFSAGNWRHEQSSDCRVF